MKALKNFIASSISPVFILGLGNCESSGSFSNVYLKPQLLQDTLTSDLRCNSTVIKFGPIMWEANLI